MRDALIVRKAPQPVLRARGSRLAPKLRAVATRFPAGDLLDLSVVSGQWHFERTNGSPGNGVADDAPYLNAQLAAGRTVILSDRKSYLIKQPLLLTAADTGIIAPMGATLRLSMAAGAFDNTLASGSRSILNTSGNKYAVGIHGGGVAGVFLKGFRIVPTSWVDCRYLRPVYLDACDEATIEDLDISGFSRSPGLIGWRDSEGVLCQRNKIHDCYTLSAFESDGTTPTTASNVQITGIEVDDAAVSGSPDFRILDNDIKRLTNGAAILAALGNVQSDAITIKGTDDKSTSGQVLGNNISDVAEGIDLFCWRTQVEGNDIHACFGAGIKMFHAASYLLINGNRIDDCGLAAIYLGGSNSSVENAVGLRVTNNLIGRVNRKRDWRGADGNLFFDSQGGTRSFWTDVFSSGTGSITAGIRIDVLNGGTSQLEGAIFSGNDMTLGGNADRGYFMEGNAGGFASTIRGKPSITGLKAGGRRIQDSGGYLILEGFAPDRMLQLANRTLTANTDPQALADAAAAGAYSADSGEVLRIRAEANLTGLSSSSTTFSLNIGGDASFVSGGISLRAVASKSGGVGLAYVTDIKTTNAAIVVSASTSTDGKLIVTGTLRVNVGGTIILQIQQGAGAAAEVLAGTVVEFTRISARAVDGNFV